MPCPICGKVAKMTADHIGPISLGFCHSRNFAPMCKKCNSAKNNRFTKNDIDRLIEIENNGEQVVSWHSQYIWDTLKYSIMNDTDAKFASSVMAKCHQNVLNLLSIIYKMGGKQFLLRYLHPEFSLVDYRFENVDLTNLDKIKIKSTPLDSKNKRKNQERYLRIAFESLDEFANKRNRKNFLLIDEHSERLKPIMSAILIENYDNADTLLKDLIMQVCDEILIKEKENAIQSK